MTSPDNFSLVELGRLASALCDGEISGEEAERLQSLATQSAEALEQLLRYLELHGELTAMMGSDT